jgi:hypothetical protein
MNKSIIALALLLIVVFAANVEARKCNRKCRLAKIRAAQVAPVEQPVEAAPVEVESDRRRSRKQKRVQPVEQPAEVESDSGNPWAYGAINFALAQVGKRYSQSVSSILNVKLTICRPDTDQTATTAVV